MPVDKEKERERKRAWSQLPEQKAKKRRYYEANRESIQEKKRQYYEANREKLKAYARDNAQAKRSQRFAYRSRYYHGGDWDAIFAPLWEAQQGACYLCGDPLRPEEYRQVHIDHDHAHCAPPKTCAICRRGLACTPCNMLIGLAKDDPERLRRIAANLEAAALGVRERMANAEPLALW